MIQPRPPVLPRIVPPFSRCTYIPFTLPFSPPPQSLRPSLLLYRTTTLSILNAHRGQSVRPQPLPSSPRLWQADLARRPSFLPPSPFPYSLYASFVVDVNRVFRDPWLPPLALIEFLTANLPVVCPPCLALPPSCSFIVTFIDMLLHKSRYPQSHIAV